jgi:hypothetical protein
MKIDLLSPASFADGQPHQQFDWLRRTPRSAGTTSRTGKGFWAVTRHADVWAVDRDFQTYSSEPTIMITDPLADAGSFGPYKMMLMMDPPEHTGFRKLIRSRVHPAAAHVREARIQSWRSRSSTRSSTAGSAISCRGGRRDALVRDRRADGPAAGRRARALQADRDHPHRAEALPPGPAARR